MPNLRHTMGLPVIALLATGLAPGSLAGGEPAVEGAPRNADGDYRNNYTHHEPTFRDFIRWAREHRRAKVDPVRFAVDPDAAAKLRAVGDGDRAATWIGHSTFLLQLDDVRILTDPHFTDRASPVRFAGPRRTTRPGVEIDDLPSIDAIVISHNHYDHLDKGSIRALLDRPAARRSAAAPGGAAPTQPVVFVPAGLGATLESWGAERVVELDWWQAAPFGDLTLTAVPVQHFSARTPFDRNRTLWAGWVIEDVADRRVFFAGDTGYSSDFRDIRSRLGAMDLSLIPIGAYDPRWFMGPMHVDPEEAVEIHLDLESRLSIGMHWGTFILTDEPMREPAERLAAAREARGIEADEFVVLRHGETVSIDGR